MQGNDKLDEADLVTAEALGEKHVPGFYELPKEGIPYSDWTPVGTLV